MEHEIAGQAVKAAMDGALVGIRRRKKEPMTGTKALKAMERVMNAPLLYLRHGGGGLRAPHQHLP